MCVNQAWWSVPAIPSLRRRRQAQPCLRKKVISTKLTFPCRFPWFPLSLHLWANWPPNHCPSSLTYLLYLNMNFPLSGTLGRDTNRENDGQFPMLSLHHHLVNPTAQRSHAEGPALPEPQVTSLSLEPHQPVHTALPAAGIPEPLAPAHKNQCLTSARELRLG